MKVRRADFDRVVVREIEEVWGGVRGSFRRIGRHSNGKSCEIKTFFNTHREGRDVEEDLSLRVALGKPAI